MKRVLILALALSALSLSTLYAQTVPVDSTDAASETMNAAADTSEAAARALDGPADAAEAAPARTMVSDDIAAGETNPIQYSISIALGSTLPFNPDEFTDNWDPSIGFMLDFAAARGILELSANIDYSFFLSNSVDPHDVNILTTFLNLKVKPLNTTARPYVFVGGGFYRAWIVNLDIYENVLGFGGGAGVEIEVDEGRRVFIEGKTLQGQTRIGAVDGIPNLRKANLEIIPIRFGITFAL